MNKFFSGLICIALILGVSTHTVYAAPQTNQTLIAELQLLIAKLQQQLAAAQASELATIDKEVSTFGSGAEVGPQKNSMSCNRTGSKLSNGKLACYGLHDYGSAFGDDENICGGLDPTYSKKLPTGCVVPAPICKSGRAIATNFFNPDSKSKSQIQKIAKKLSSTPSVVKAQIINLWEYSCTNKPLTTLDSVSVYENNPESSLGIHQPVAYSKKNWSFVKRPSQVVVVGVYQASDAQNGKVDVSLDYIEPDTLLVLSSYEPVEWNLIGQNVKNVKAIYLTGYEKSRVLGVPAGVPVQKDIYKEGAPGFFIVYNGTGEEDDEFYELRSYIHSVTNQKAYLYFGSYDSSLIQVSLKG